MSVNREKKINETKAKHWLTCLFIFWHIEHKLEVSQLQVQMTFGVTLDQMASFTSHTHWMPLAISHLRIIKKSKKTLKEQIRFNSIQID